MSFSKRNRRYHRNKFNFSRSKNVKDDDEEEEEDEDDDEEDAVEEALKSMNANTKQYFTKTFNSTEDLYATNETVGKMTITSCVYLNIDYSRSLKTKSI